MIHSKLQIAHLRCLFKIIIINNKLLLISNLINFLSQKNLNKKKRPEDMTNDRPA